MKYKNQIISLVILLGILTCTTAYVANAGRLNYKKQKNTASQNIKNKKDKINNNKEVSKNISIPVLEYQAVNPNYVTVDNFKNQMNYLKNVHYTTITIDDLYEYFTKGKKLPEKPILITIDNGYSSTGRSAYSTLKELGFKATVFVSTDLINTHDYLSTEQLKDMQNNNISIQCNGPNRNTFNSLSGEQLKTALSSSKSKLEGILGKPVNYIAYPKNYTKKDSINEVKSANFKMAFNSAGSFASKDNDLFYINRIPIEANDTFDGFKEKLSKN